MKTFTSCGLPPSTKYSRDLWQWSQHPCDETVSDASAAGRDLFAKKNENWKTFFAETFQTNCNDLSQIQKFVIFVAGTNCLTFFC